MKLTADEINSLALVIAKILAQGEDKKDIIIIKNLFNQIANNLTAYILWEKFD